MPQRFDPEPEDSQDFQNVNYAQSTEGVYGPSVLIAALDQIEVMVEEARAVPLSPNVIVNKAGVVDLIGQAREALPEDLVAADAVVADADAVLDRADQAAEATVAEANTKARAIVDEARDKADVILHEAAEEAERREKRAHESAEKTIEQAHTQAGQILEQAKQQAAQLVSEQAVLTQAQKEARDLLYQAKTQAADLKLGADDYAATALSQISQVLEDLLRRTEAGRRTIADRNSMDSTKIDFK